MIRLENRGKLDDLSLEIDTITLKSGDLRFESNTADNSNRSMISGGFWLLYALIKGESWINWGSKLAPLIKNRYILVRVLYIDEKFRS
jgi:hypothetical protein